ncbi:MAG TPA: acylphosphatase [Candidatus Paceibacterota bacterium]|jgi:acylphosphatase|nr:acylphosphatase [Candidatus Paceibacterota bacterium]
MTKRLECIVSGRVQGVLFRDFTQRTAKKLKLAGTVENLPDGTVKAIAEGDEIKLAEFLSKLKKGPLLSNVKDVKVEWFDATNIFLDFKIVYHGFLDHL